MGLIVCRSTPDQGKRECNYRTGNDAKAQKRGESKGSTGYTEIMKGPLILVGGEELSPTERGGGVRQESTWQRHLERDGIYSR